MEWTNHIVGHDEVSPDELTAHPLNINIHPRYQYEAVEQMLKEVGWVKPVIVNQRTGYIVDGHLRVMVAIEKGIEKIPVDYVDLTEEQEAQVLSGYDLVGRLADKNAERLAGIQADISQGALGQSLRELLESISPVVPVMPGKPVKTIGGAATTVRIMIGAFSLKVPQAEYIAWRDKLISEHGSNALDEIKRRLGVLDEEPD